jgi:hypothetical protein
MVLKHVALSLVLGVAGGFVAYVLAWGLFTTHPELGMQPDSGRSIALWVAPATFLVSLIYFSVKSRTGSGT